MYFLLGFVIIYLMIVMYCYDEFDVSFPVCLVYPLLFTILFVVLCITYFSHSESDKS